MTLDLPPMRRRIAIVLAILVVEYALTMAGLSLRGVALDAIGSHRAISFILVLVVCFSLAQMITTQLTNARAWLRSGWAIGDNETFWRRYLPRRVKNAERERADYYFQLLTSYLPRLAYFAQEIPLQTAQAGLALAAFVGYALYYQIYLVLLAIPLIFGSAMIAARYKADDYREATRRISQDKEYAAGWLKSYFGGNKEIELVFRREGDFDDRAGFLRVVPARMTRSLRFHQRTVVGREFLMGILEEYPYVLGVGVAIVVGAYQGLSIGQIYVISSMVTYLNNANSRLQRRKSLLIEEQSYVQLARAKLIDETTATPGDAPAELASLALLDGTVVEIGAAPGLYQVMGKNGSGKSTLVDSVCGFSDHYADDARVTAIRDRIAGRAIVLSDAPVVFDYMDTLASLISGHAEAVPSPEAVEHRIVANARTLLPASLVETWRDALAHVDGKWTEYRELSRGERVLLSCLRALYHWQPDVRLVVIDECEYFLQASWRTPFLETVHALAEARAVYFISHHTVLVPAKELAS